MADFDPPHGNNSTTKRYPSHEEAQKGFDCGPADRDRFNGQLYRLEAELGELIKWAGITPSNDRMTQVREAIQSKMTPFLKSVNEDVDGGTLTGDLFSFLMSDGKKWDLKFPSQNTQGFSLVSVRAVAGRNTSTAGDHGTVTHSISLHQSEKDAVKNIRYALVTVRTIVDVHLSENGHSHLNTRSKSSISSSPQFCQSSMGLDPTPSGWGFRNEITMRDNNLFIVPVENGKISLVGELSLFIDHAGIVRTPNSGYYAYAGYVAYLIGVA